MRPLEMVSGAHLTDAGSATRLPEYRTPPVVETALAVEFAPIAGWNLLYFGALWGKYRNEYPKTELFPAMPSLEMDFLNPPLRYCLKSADGSQLIQLRSGAFVKNWRATPDNNEYPRYKSIRPSFERDLRVFYEFLSANHFAMPEVWKCEVTYVNHFLRGREWSDTSDLHKLLPVLSRANLSPLLSRPSQLGLAINYDLPDEVGNLQIGLAPGLSPEGKELLQLTLTAYGKPKSSDIPDLLDWIDRGRFAVVQGFSDFTSAEVQTTVWGRIWP